MPGSGKSTTGIILAKNLSLGFIDTDILIQINRQKSLQEIMDETNYLNLRTVEEEEILKINVANHVIATGGSAVYSERAMRHLQDISAIVYLEASLSEIEKRITNFGTRGVAKAEDQSFRELFEERQALYGKYAEVTVACNSIVQDEVARRIALKLKN